MKTTLFGFLAATLTLTAAALPAGAATSYPLVCRGNSSPTFTSNGPKTHFSFVRNQTGPVTANGLAIAGCSWTDRAMRADEPSVLASISMVSSFILGGKFLSFFAQEDAYVNRFRDSDKYFFLYVANVSGVLAITSSLGDAMDDAPKPMQTNSGSTALPMLRDDFTPSCGSSNTPDVYYHVQLGITRRIQASTAGSGFDTVLSVIDATGKTFGCNDDADAQSRHSALDLTLPPGDYYLVVDGYAASTGNFALSFGIQ